MSATPRERETGIKTGGREQVGSVEADTRALGSRSLEAGGEFLRALAGDLATVVFRLRLWLLAKHGYMKGRASDLARHGSWIGPWLVEQHRSLKAAAGNLVARGSRASGSRSLEAGGEFLKALAGDLAAVMSRLRLWLIAEYRRTGTSRASALRDISWESIYGGKFRILRIALLGLLSGSTVMLLGVTLWVLYGSPIHSRSASVHTPGVRIAAGRGEPLGGVGPIEVTGASRRDLARQPGAQARAQDRPVAEAMIPPAAASDQSGSSSVNAAEQRAKETQAEAGAGADQPQLARTETQDTRPTAWQQEAARALTDSRPRMQCNVDLCAATYRSFHAADCTYQPYRGGPRSFCELTTRSADGLPQTSPAATDPRSEATDTRVAERPGEGPMSAMPDQAGPQCNIKACAAMYRSFHAADCTYQPYGGGRRRICE